MKGYVGKPRLFVCGSRMWAEKRRHAWGCWVTMRYFSLCAGCEHMFVLGHRYSINRLRLCGQCRSAYGKLQSVAQREVKKAIRRGLLQALDGSVKCSDCDQPAKDYDHRDYREPLLVSPVCRSHNVIRGNARWMAG